MRILIIGGTIFLGRALVEAALEHGHEVTLFNRGLHHPNLFPNVEKLRGDRKEDLSALNDRQWDIVIDTCGYVPRIVRMSAEALRDAVDCYIFISSISVFPDLAQSELNEDAPVATLEDEAREDVTGETYGALKALCERVVEEVLPGRALNIRPGLIVGPFDPSSRFGYWPRRVAAGGTVLAPGSPDQAVQFIDVRDLAEWTIRMAERKHNGVYNVTGPASPLSMEHMLQTCKEVTKSDAEFIWVPDEFLLERQVVPFTELPLWVPADAAGIHRVDCRKALAEGLTFRSLTTTIQDVLVWEDGHREEVANSPYKNLSEEREKSILQEWNSASVQEVSAGA